LNLDNLPSFLLALLSATLFSGLPIALAALGGLFTELAGTLSVALEGSMLAGAFAALLAYSATSSFAAAALAATLAGMAAGLLVGFAATRLRADVFVSGLAVNLLVPALLSLLSQRIFATKGVAALPPKLAERALAEGGASLIIMTLALALLWFLLARTPLGLRLRAAGERGEAARAAGLDAEALRLLAHAVAGAAAGLAGFSLTLSIAAYVPGMSAGKGWMALVAIYLGLRRPLGILLSGLGFGFLLALANLAQRGAWLPPELLPALPYLLTALVYTFSRSGKRARGGDNSEA